MKKLTILHPKHGDIVATEPEEIKKEFEKIMKEGYGGHVPATFMAEYNDGSLKAFPGKSATGLLDDPDVKEVTVIPPIAGGNYGMDMD